MFIRRKQVRIEIEQRTMQVVRKIAEEPGPAAASPVSPPEKQPIATNPQTGQQRLEEPRQ